jgi:glycerophosphoryl diester phosphodiesterase
MKTCMYMIAVLLTAIFFMVPLVSQTPAKPAADSTAIITLMRKAAAHAAAHHTKYKPVLSPAYQSVLSGAVDVPALHSIGVQIIPWTVNDADTIRALLAKHVDGIISDDPALLMQTVAEVKAAAVASNNKPELNYLAHFDPQAHRGGRALRPENTLPSFENGMDHGVTTLETDTGVTNDGQSLIWHDQFLSPLSCRHADGSPYTLDNKVYTQDITMAEAQHTFICDKLRFGKQQQNNLALSPVAVAFAKAEGMPSPYAPTNAAQLMRFTKFYAHYYRSGPGKNSPNAAARAHTGETIKFNLETKIQGPENLPAWPGGNHTRPAQDFVDALVGAIKSEHMEARADVQSFYFGTLLLIQEQHPEIQTVYLTEDPKNLKLTSPPELQ